MWSRFLTRERTTKIINTTIGLRRAEIISSEELSDAWNCVISLEQKKEENLEKKKKHLMRVNKKDDEVENFSALSGKKEMTKHLTRVSKRKEDFAALSRKTEMVRKLYLETTRKQEDLTEGERLAIWQLLSHLQQRRPDEGRQHEGGQHEGGQDEGGQHEGGQDDGGQDEGGSRQPQWALDALDVFWNNKLGRS